MLTDQFPDPNSFEGLQYMLGAAEDAMKEPACRVGGIYGHEWESPYPDRPPGITLHLTWLEPDDVSPDAPPRVIALNLHIPEELIPFLSSALASIKRRTGPRKIARKSHQRQRPRKR